MNGVYTFVLTRKYKVTFNFKQYDVVQVMIDWKGHLILLIC